MGELERKQRVWCLRARCLLARLDVQDFVEAAEAGVEGADLAEAEDRLKFLDVFTREFESKRIKYLEAAKRQPQVVAANAVGRTNTTATNLSQGNIAMIRLRTQARELHRKYSKWRSDKTKTESKQPVRTSSARKQSKVAKQSKHPSSTTSTSRITSTHAELQPSLPPQSPTKPQRRKSVADSQKPTPKSLLPAHRTSSPSIFLDKTHVIRSKSMSPSLSAQSQSNNMIVLRAQVHPPHCESRALSPNTLKRVSWVPPDYAPPPKVSHLSRQSMVFGTADAQQRMVRINRALSTSTLKQEPQLKPLKPETFSLSPTHKLSSHIAGTQGARNLQTHDIVFPKLPFPISGGKPVSTRSPVPVSAKPSADGLPPAGSFEHSPRMTATFSHTLSSQQQPRSKSVARKLRLESDLPATAHSGGRARPSFSRSVSAPRVRVTTRRKRGGTKSKVLNRTRKKRPPPPPDQSARRLPRQRSRSRSKSRHRSACEASDLPALQNFISISRAEINGNTLTLKPGTLLFYGRLVFEFQAPVRSPQFHMLSEPEAAAWHVLNLWRDNLAHGIKKVPRFAYIHAYRVTSDVKFAVRAAWEMVADECDENLVIQDSVSRCTAWDKNIRSLDSLKRYFRGLRVDQRHLQTIANDRDFTQSRSKCHITSHRAKPHRQPRDRARPCCKLFFGEPQEKNHCVELELTRVYEVDIVEWLERMLQEQCSLNRARILPLLRHPFKMRRHATCSGSPLKQNTGAAVDILSYMFRE